jgi:hypothetical protein
MYISEHFINSILDEGAKWKELVAAGKLGTNAIKRIKQGGLVKSPEEYFKGIDKGTQNIIDKHNIHVSHNNSNALNNAFKLNSGSKMSDITNHTAKYGIREPLSIYSHTMATPQKVTVHVPDIKNIPHSERDLHSIIKRHEADEAVEYLKNLKKYKRKRLDNNTPEQHQSDNVLKKEQKILSTANRLYSRRDGLGTPGRDRLNHMRLSTGEYAHVDMKTNKQIKKDDHERAKRSIQDTENEVKRIKSLQPHEQKKELDKLNKDFILNAGKRVAKHWMDTYK